MILLHGTKIDNRDDRVILELVGTFCPSIGLVRKWIREVT